MDLITLALARKYTTKAISDSLPDIQEQLGLYKYKGSVNSFSDLPTTEMSVGDVYNVEDEFGQNYAWNGSNWDSLGSTLQADAKVDTVSIINNNGILALSGFGDALSGTSPVKSTNGTLIWEPSATQIIGVIPEASPATTVIEYIDLELAKKVNGISINGELIDTNAGVVEIPLATQDSLGLVKSSQNENSIFVLEDGTMEINSLNTNKLVQTEGEELVLYCGEA